MAARPVSADRPPRRRRRRRRAPRPSCVRRRPSRGASVTARRARRPRPRAPPGEFVRCSVAAARARARSCVPSPVSTTASTGRDPSCPTARRSSSRIPGCCRGRTVLDNVVLGSAAAATRRPRPRGARARSASPITSDDWPKTLSGGEAQRAALARALVREPGAPAARRAVRRARRARPASGCTRSSQQLCARHRPAVLLVTHDVDEAILLADRVLVLTDGGIALDCPVDVAEPPAARRRRVRRPALPPARRARRRRGRRGARPARNPEAIDPTGIPTRQEPAP